MPILIRYDFYRQHYSHNGVLAQLRDDDLSVSPTFELCINPIFSKCFNNKILQAAIGNHTRNSP